MQKELMDALKRRKNKIGVIVFSILTLLTIFEFVIARSTSLTGLLVFVALTKAFLIIIYFMHFSRLISISEE